jgi:hypothetical protein
VLRKKLLLSNGFMFELAVDVIRDVVALIFVGTRPTYPVVLQTSNKNGEEQGPTITIQAGRHRVG